MHRLKTLASALVVALVVITCLDYAASAATGGQFLLGRLNKANKISTVQRTTSGSALQLKTTTSAAPPLVVNGRGKVANLNADLLDGLDSSALRTSSYSFTRNVTVATTNTTLTLPLPAGTYVVGYDAYMGGGGLDNSVAGCYLWRLRGADYTYYGETRFLTKSSNAAGASGSSIITVAAGDSVALYCHAGAAWTTDASQPIHVYATRTALIGSSVLRTAPAGTRQAR